MAPVDFPNIAGSTNGLLGRDFFHLSPAALEIKTKAPNGVAFTVRGKSQDDKSISGGLEAKYADKASGLALTQAWSTANVVDTKIELDEALTPGLKTEVSTSFLPTSGTKAAKLGIYFRQPSINARAFFDLLKGPSFTGDATVGHDGFLAGAEVGYDVLGGRITKYSAAIGYSVPVYSAAITATNNLSLFSASYYHKVNPAVEAGAKATWNSKSASQVSLEVGTKYAIDSNASAKAKINSAGIASLSYLQTLRPGVKLGLGISVDTQRLQEPAHKLGFSLAFDA
ncbi:porin POR1 [Dipodascopsis tothii]|uniref:porin POR1 n=1 Tax=Dipodascopsis tothii TaxID=44089 RepID=UPI0034CE6C81